jgi:hypothetical protein
MAMPPIANGTIGGSSATGWVGSITVPLSSGFWLVGTASGYAVDHVSGLTPASR